jgi:predicted nucleic acid-binding protein
MARYLVDTNVLLRAGDPNSAQHSAAIEAVGRLISRNHEVCLAPQVISEFWVVATRPTNVNGLGWSFETVEPVVTGFLLRFPLLAETPRLFLEWHRLVVNYRVMGKQAHDTRLVAIMNTNAVAHLLTFNVNNFRAYGVNVVSPDDVIAS